jgi:hypothetical protein
VGQGHALQYFGAVGELGAFGLEELPPGRRVVVEVAHFDTVPAAERGRFGSAPGSPARRQAWRAPAARLVSVTRATAGDRSQRFAAEAPGGDPFEVVELS